MIIFSHPTGNANVRAALNAFAQEGLLAEFVTAVATFDGNFFDRLSRTRLGSEFARRRFSQTLQPITRQHAFKEVSRMVAAKIGLKSLIRHETGLFCIDRVYRGIDSFTAKRVKSHERMGALKNKQHVALSIRRTLNAGTSPNRISNSAVYCYEDAALQTFRESKRLGFRCFYDLPIGYWRTARRLLEGEQERWPEWRATLSGFRDSPEKLARKDEELQLADDIFVASTFTKKTLSDYPGQLAPVHVIPYGFPAAGEQREYTDLGKRKLKLLFVGGLSQRKGIADVFAVADMLKDDVELTVVGQGAVNECVALNNALKKHKWIPSLPHAQILELMRQHDVLLFPSLFEGFGLVITEAMSQGTPVITTNRTVGPDLIEHGKNGWLIEAGSTIALQTQVEEILNNRNLVSLVGESARQSALLRPWSVYGNEMSYTILGAWA